MTMQYPNSCYNKMCYELKETNVYYLSMASWTSDGVNLR